VLAPAKISVSGTEKVVEVMKGPELLPAHEKRENEVLDLTC